MEKEVIYVVFHKYEDDLTHFKVEIATKNCFIARIKLQEIRENIIESMIKSGLYFKIYADTAECFGLKTLANKEHKVWYQIIEIE